MIACNTAFTHKGKKVDVHAASSSRPAGFSTSVGICSSIHEGGFPLCEIGGFNSWGLARVNLRGLPHCAFWRRISVARRFEYLIQPGVVSSARRKTMKQLLCTLVCLPNRGPRGVAILAMLPTGADVAR